MVMRTRPEVTLYVQYLSCLVSEVTITDFKISNSSISGIFNFSIGPTIHMYFALRDNNSFFFLRNSNFRGFWTCSKFFQVSLES